EQAFGADEIPVALAYEFIGNTAVDMNRWDGAKTNHQRAAQIFAKSLGDDHPYVAFAQVVAARDMAELGELDAAEALVRPNAAAHLRLPARGAHAQACHQNFRRVLDLQARRKLEQADYAAYLRYRKEMAENGVDFAGPKHQESKRLRYDLANAQ